MSIQLKLNKFRSLLEEKSVTSSQAVTWDVVVVTSADENQKKIFEIQIEDCLKRNKLPKQSHYLVVCDPPGYKIGNGGSTLVVLKELQKKFGEDFNLLKILIIHAGGYSQRFLCASALGKAFVKLPIGDGDGCTMMQLKLITYIDLPEKIQNGGVFVCCSDTIEVFDDCDWQFEDQGFTALGHPSSLKVGTTHGVFVLDPKDQNKIKQSCRIFLHKPSIEKMRSSGAVETPKDLVLTDSSFFISSSLCLHLLRFYQKIEPLTCEIDAYGDFLQASGSDCDGSYIMNTSNVVSQSQSLISSRRQVFEWLRGTRLSVIVLHSDDGSVTSSFHHLGTISEYKQHLTSSKSLLRRQLHLDSLHFCLGHVTHFKFADDVIKEKKTSGELLQDREGNAPCLMTSLIHGDVTVGVGSVIEMTRIGIRCQVGRNCLVSGTSLPADSVVPDDVFVHTIATTRDDDVTAYVTCVFGVDDDIKKKGPNVLWAGTRVPCDVIDCLWTLKLFPMRETMEDSVSASLKIFKDFCEFGRKVESEELFSIDETLKRKNVDVMLKYRSKLREEISDRLSSESMFDELSWAENL